MAHRNVQSTAHDRRARWLKVLMLAALCSMMFAWRAEADDVRTTNAPVFVNLSIDASMITKSSRNADRKAAVEQMAAQIAAKAKTQPNRFITIRMKGAPLQLADLPAKQRSEFTRRFSNQADSKYALYMAGMLDEIIQRAQRSAPRARIGVYGLPNEHARSKNMSLTLLNSRYQRVIDQLDVFVSPRQMILSNPSLEESRTIRRSLSEAARLADGRPIVFRTNGAWRLWMPGQSNHDEAVSLPVGVKAADSATEAESATSEAGAGTTPQPSGSAAGASAGTGSSGGSGGSGSKSGGGGGGGGGGQSTAAPSLKSGTNADGVDSTKADYASRNTVGSNTGLSGGGTTGSGSSQNGGSGNNNVVSSTAWSRTFNVPQSIGALNVTGTDHTFTVAHSQLGTLRSATGHVLHRNAGQLLVVSNIIPKDGGFDITYTISNPTNQAHTLPDLMLTGNMLGSEIEYLEHHFGNTFIGLSAAGTDAVYAPSRQYPRVLYSPVMIARNSQLAMGISLLYPMMEYQHQIRTRFFRPANQSDWVAIFTLEGEMPAGAQRSYTVTVRYGLKNDWIHTLRPYRDYFWSMYGQTPRYEQDLRPVYRYAVSLSEWNTADNPRGFRPWIRPDQNGWKDEVDVILDLLERSDFQRITLVTPSGTYRHHPDNNMPPQFMSAWPSAMKDTAHELNRIRDAGVEVTAWWGRSAQVADKWDDDVLEEFEPSDPTHANLMRQEMILAAQRGFDGVGLDFFRRMPPWKALPWLEELRAIAPNAHFVAEPACYDVLHLQTPVWVQAEHLPMPHYMADYLIPTREIWAHLRGDQLTHERAVELVKWGMTLSVNPSTMQPELTREYLVENSDGILTD